jgi:hypothetical protein
MRDVYLIPHVGMHGDQNIGIVDHTGQAFFLEVQRDSRVNPPLQEVIGPDIRGGVHEVKGLEFGEIDTALIIVPYPEFGAVYGEQHQSCQQEQRIFFQMSLLSFQFPICTNILLAQKGLINKGGWFSPSLVI